MLERGWGVECGLVARGAAGDFRKVGAILLPMRLLLPMLLPVLLPVLLLLPMLLPVLLLLLLLLPVLLPVPAADGR